MTWLKLSDDFGDECANAALSDAAFRTHVEALLWTMRRQSGGRITARDVRRFAESTDAEPAVKELLKRGFWTETGDGYVIEHHMEHQIEPEVMEKRRLMTAERQRRKRLKAAQLKADSEPVTRDIPRDDPRYVGTGLGWSGLDRKPPKPVAPKKKDQGNAPQKEENWPEVTVPGTGWSDELYDRE